MNSARKQFVLFFVATIISVLALSLPVWAGTQDDSILSQHIQEADGTTGQDTNAGSGIKTGHIQNGAVTALKIAVAAITTDKIASGAITTDKISDGAVTDSKITGPISASKISSSGLDADTVDGLHAADLALSSHTHAQSDVTGLVSALAGKAALSHVHDYAPTVHTHAQSDVTGLVTALAGKAALSHVHDYAPTVHSHSQSDVTGLVTALAGKANVSHNHDGTYQKKYTNVIVVAESGGDFTSPRDAMNSISGSSASNPYLIKIMPGEYDVPYSILVKDYVDIEGSGVNMTHIIGCSFLYVRDGATTEIRDLSLECAHTDSNVQAIVIQNLSRVILTNIDISVINNTTVSNTKSDYVFNSTNSELTMNNVNISMESLDQPLYVAYGFMGGGRLDGSARVEMNGGSIKVANAKFMAGVSIYHGEVILNNVDIEVPSGYYSAGVQSGHGQGASNYTPTVIVENSRVKADNALDVMRYYAYSDLLAVNSRLDGALVSSNGALLKLVNCYDDNYDPIANGTY